MLGAGSIPRHQHNGGRGVIVLDLPYPTSTNRIWRSGHSRVHKSVEYKTWRRAAENLFLAQKRGCVAVKGHFRADIILSSAKRRSNADCDNRSKAVLDFLEAMNLIENDCLCDRVSIEWGAPEQAPEGCRVFVFPTEEQRRAA